MLLLVAQRVVKEIHGNGGSLRVLTGDAGQSSALAADGDVEGQIALLPQLLDGHIPAHLDAAADIHAQLPQHLNFPIDHVLFQLEGGDAIGQHAAGALILFKHRGLIATGGQIIGGGQTGRACTDDGDLLLPMGLLVGGNDHRRDIAGLGVQILLRQEFFHCINGHGLIHAAPGAGILAALVADAAADGGEGIVLFDQRQRILIFALRRQLQIALDGHMGGAGSFAGSGALVVAVLPIVVPVVGIPVLRPPLDGIGQLVLGVGHFPALLVAELLAQADGTGGAILHAFATGHALFALHLCRVGRAGQVGGIEQLTGSQSVADLHIAVADAENLVFAVDVGNLVDKAIILRLLQDAHGLLIGDVMALAGLPAVVGEVAHADAPALLVVRAALAHGGPTGAAGALAHADVPLVLFQPVGQVLNVQGLIFHGDRLLHRDNVHTHTTAARGQQMGDPRQGNIGHTLKEIADLRGIPQALIALRPLLHVKKLRAARHKHGQDVPPRRGGRGAAVVVVVVAVVIFQQADVAHLVQQLLEVGPVLLPDPVHLPQLLHGVGRAQLHGQGDICHLVGDQGRQAPVFRVVRRNALHLVRHYVRDLPSQLQDLLPGCCLPPVHRVQCPLLQFLVDHFCASFFIYIITSYALSCFHCRTCRVIHSAKAGTPSPVLALMGKIWILGLRIFA